MSTQDNSRTRSDRKESYEHVLSCVDHQTSPVQPPGCPRSTVVGCLARRGRHGQDAIETAFRAAVENDDLVVWTDHDGTERYSLVEKAKLRRVIERAAGWDEPDKALIGRMNRLLDDLS